MPNNIINASSSGSGGLITTAADSGSLELQSDGTTIATLSSTGLTMAAGKKVFSEGSVLQVVSTTKTDTFSTSSTTFTDITGLSVSITPSSASSKILVIVNVLGSQDVNGNRIFMKLLRDSTSICIGDAAGSRDRVSFGSSSYETVFMTTWSQNYLDSPSTTSATTYKIQMRVSGTTGYINRADDDTDSSIYQRGASSITVMEIKG